MSMPKKSSSSKSHSSKNSNSQSSMAADPQDIIGQERRLSKSQCSGFDDGGSSNCSRSDISSTQQRLSEGKECSQQEHGIEIKSLRAQLKAARGEAGTLRQIHKLELSSLQERNTFLQELGAEKEKLLQEVIVNFKNLRKSMQLSHKKVKTERDQLRTRIINLEMRVNKSDVHTEADPKN